MLRCRAPSNQPGTFFVAQSWADCITNMFVFDLRQAQSRGKPSNRAAWRPGSLMAIGLLYRSKFIRRVSFKPSSGASHCRQAAPPRASLSQIELPSHHPDEKARVGLWHACDMLAASSNVLGSGAKRKICAPTELFSV